MTAVLAAGTFLLAFLLTRRFLEPGSAFYLVDRPNERSLHDRPIPRGGGIAIAIAVYAGGAAVLFLYGGAREIAWLGVGGGAVAFISYLDDASDVRPLVRFGVHLLAGSVLVIGGLGLPGLRLPGVEFQFPSVVGPALALLFIIWMINLYNFMDGMDGFAGGMAVIGFGSFALLAGWQGEQGFMAVSIVVAAASGGFLLLNFPPARIFMGDVGSSLLGYTAAGLILWADRERIFPLWIGCLVFSPFIVDATVTLLRRLARGDRVWEAHRVHYYQRLVRSGWGHRRTVLAEYGLMIAGSLAAIVALDASVGGQRLLLAAGLVVYLTVMALVDRADRRRARA